MEGLYHKRIPFSDCDDTKLGLDHAMKCLMPEILTAGWALRGMSCARILTKEEEGKAPSFN